MMDCATRPYLGNFTNPDRGRVTALQYTVTKVGDILPTTLVVAVYVPKRVSITTLVHGDLDHFWLSLVFYQHKFCVRSSLHFYSLVVENHHFLPIAYSGIDIVP